MFEESDDLENMWSTREITCAACNTKKPLHMYPKDSYSICMACKIKSLENSNLGYTCAQMSCPSIGDFNMV